MSRTAWSWTIAFVLASSALAVSMLRTLTQQPDPSGTSQGAESIRARLSTATSFAHLPAPDRDIAEFLLLLPIAAALVCILRNVIGLHTYGTFAPALIGLAFRDVGSWPSLLVFLAVLFTGWLGRRRLERLHLLQAPRSALMLTVVCAMVLLFVALAQQRAGSIGRCLHLFPLVILVSMIERFWTLDEEDGPWESFRTLLVTLLTAACVAGVTGRSWLVRHMLAHPESLGFVMAGLVLLGRYTGYRLMELYRFRSLVVEDRAPEEPVSVTVVRTTAPVRRF